MSTKNPNENLKPRKGLMSALKLMKQTLDNLDLIVEGLNTAFQLIMGELLTEKLEEQNNVKQKSK